MLFRSSDLFDKIRPKLEKDSLLVVIGSTAIDKINNQLKIREILQEILDKEIIDLEYNFFEIGGTSLSGIRFINKLNRYSFCHQHR